MKIASLIILTLLPVAFSQDPTASSKSDDDGSRVKRAGFSLFTGALQNLHKSAFSASASLSSGSSSQASGLSGSSSSSHDTHGESYGSGYEETHHETKSFDGWSLKKSILNTLLQAVKAIAGGVTTLSGQLIKGSGYLVSQKGKLIAKGGDAVSDAGKSVIASAHLIKPESSGHGSQNSIGHALGSTFGDLSSGLTKSISGLSASSSGSITSLSSGSAGQVTSLSGSPSHGGSSSGGISNSHGESYGSENHGPSYYNIPENNYASYDAKPAVGHDSYGPPKVSHEFGSPKPTYSYVQDPHTGYGAPGDFDESLKSSSNQEAADILSNILKDLPHKPMKSLGNNNNGHSFNQLPIPNDFPTPPFKQLKSFPTHSHNIPFQQNLQSEFGSTNHYSEYSFNEKPTSINPKAQYHDDSFKSSSNKEVADVVSSILKDFPHKPMKSLGNYNNDHSFTQLPISNDLHTSSFPNSNDLHTSSFPNHNNPFPQNIHSEYDDPSKHYSKQLSNESPTSVNPNAYDIYHSMKIRTSQDKNFVTLPPFLDNIDNKGLEIRKSIEYVIKA